MRAFFRQWPLISVYALLALLSFLWISFFTTDGPIFGRWVSMGLSLLTFAIFVALLLLQMMPKISIRSSQKIWVAVVSALFIPTLIIVFAHAFLSIGLPGADTRADYVYFSVVTFTTLGYGDISPTGIGRIFAILEALSGFLFVPLLISQLITATNDLKDQHN